MGAICSASASAKAARKLPCGRVGRGSWHRYLALFASTFRIAWNVRPLFFSYLAKFSPASNIHLYAFRDAPHCVVGLGTKRPSPNIYLEFVPTFQDTDGLTRRYPSLTRLNTTILTRGISIAIVATNSLQDHTSPTCFCNLIIVRPQWCA